jgi:uncharacterized membrane protein YdjX (TVP38/TMEM64 family)
MPDQQPTDLSGAPPGHEGRPAAALVTARRLRLFVIAVVIAGVLAASEVLHQPIVNAIDLAVPVIKGHQLLGVLLFLVLAALSAMLMFFSGVVLVTVGVEAWGVMGCLLLLWAGWFLGGLATYLLGRRFGRRTLAWMLSEDVVARYEGRIPANPSFLTAVLAQLALPSDVSGYFFGLLRYPAHLYLSGLMVAELPYAAGTVLLGEAFVRRQYVLLLGAAGAGLAILGVMWLGSRRARVAAA